MSQYYKFIITIKSITIDHFFMCIYAPNLTRCMIDSPLNQLLIILEKLLLDTI